MIKVENGSVQLYCSKEEMLQLIATANLTAKEASQVITGIDLSILFHSLVDRYSLDEAMTLWTTPVEAYKDLILIKGEHRHDDN